MRHRARRSAAALAAAAVLAGCGTAPDSSVAMPPSPEPTTTTTPLPTLTPSPTAGPSTDPAPDPSATARRVEARLDALGYPVGVVDGEILAYARQALCAWRETAGLPVTRGGLTAGDTESVLSAEGKPYADRPDGLYVNKTCQILYQVVDHEYRRIVRVSTAAPGYTTPDGVGRVWRKWPGWHESSLYDDALMYDSLYFRRDHPAIALHGSISNDIVHTYPASHGCVRVWRPQISEIFDETAIGTRVEVYGAY